MKREKLFKYLSFGLFAVITAILMVATIMEKLHGTPFALENIYRADWMIALWAAATLSAIVYLLQRKLHKQPATLCLHLSFAVILAGALVTHITGKQGQTHLRIGEYINIYALADGSTEKFPFSISLDNFEVLQYAGTNAPMDFISSIVIFDGKRIEGEISMNNIFKYRGYRFYQAGYDHDRKGTFLSVSYDPWGIGVTYGGYTLLLLSMLLFFAQPGSRFRTALRKGGVALLVMFSTTTANAQEKPQTLPEDAAEEFCRIYICYNDRICPLQTLAIDFTAKVYGKRSYKEYTAEQVLCGWFFYYDEWKNEPMIKIKGEDVKEALGIRGDYAALTDFTGRQGYKLEKVLQENGNHDIKDFATANEKFNIISMLCTGTLLKIFPYSEADNKVTWYSFADKLPGGIPQEQQLFINKSMNLVAEKVAMQDYESVKSLIAKIKRYQIKEGAESIPSKKAFDAEMLYNNMNSNRPLAMACLAIGTITFLFFCLKSREETCAISNVCERYQGYFKMNFIYVALKVLAWTIVAYLTLLITLRWYISGHIPLSNGHETMIFMAWCSMLLTPLLAGRMRMMLPFGYIVCGFTLLVATMGEATPQITPLMPVLQSPLLCIHVLVIMISYTLLAFTMLNGIAAVIIKLRGSHVADKEIAELQRTSTLMLYPAVFLLTAGIFIGAVWANVSWGRYWGWDPKEVWALITMLVYSVALHSGSIKAMRRPMFFHIYCILAFLTVLITYFGVNFILGGMHSYA